MNMRLILTLKRVHLKKRWIKKKKIIKMKYTNKCENCDYEAKANKKYLALQLIKNPRDSCCKNKMKRVKKTTKCTQCDFAINESSNMKRHMRDVHRDKTVSTSPPPKKRKSISEELDERIEEMEMESDSLDDLSFNMEEMEIDISDEEIIEERSKLMDEKVEIKEKKAFEKDIVLKTKNKDLQKKKVEAAELKAMKGQELKKKLQQKQKDQKKKERKKRKLNVSVNGKNLSIPNIRNIPQNCKHLVQKGDVLYVVPGDGCCGPNCAAAHLFQDELFGPKLRRRMNLFFAKHWYKKYQFVSQCSVDHSFVRKHRDGDVNYTDPEELIKFLETSSKADHMWSDSEDLAVIADMYQIRIKIITTKGSKDTNPSVNFIYPDANLKDFAELKNVAMNDMVLLHEDDIHFNLIISGESDLAKCGSLSHRFSIGPQAEAIDRIDQSNNTETEIDKNKQGS